MPAVSSPYGEEAKRNPPRHAAQCGLRRAYPSHKALGLGRLIAIELIQQGDRT
jgi:hypothetical protein